MYLESIKPIIYGEDEEKKTTARNVLYTCIENGLKILSPFMPYLTEELFQRLPPRPTNERSAASITVASFPEKVGI